MAIKEAKVVTITSVKGGTGKTVTTLNLAGILENRKLKVLIIDLDLYAGGIDLLLKLEPKRDLFNLIDDVNNNQFESIDDYTCKYSEYIDVITSPHDPRNANKIYSKYLNLVLGKTKSRYDVILVDTNHFMNDINLVMFDASDEIVYIIDNDLIGLKNMRTMVSIYTDMEKKNYKIILNEAKKQKGYFTPYDIKHMINNNINYTIPSSFYIKNIEKYFLDGKIPTLDKRIKSYHKKGLANLEKIANLLYKVEKKESKAQIEEQKKVEIQNMLNETRK
ncbi:MAG: AAA family ATPase [Bacilli bacterium]|nr:AAA family ATPase [Bacilli bacterium]